MDISRIHSVDQMNMEYRDFISYYNTQRPHAALDGRTPFEVYQSSTSVARKAKSREWLDMCFMNRIRRKVRKDNTVSVDRTLYDIPPGHAGEEIELRFRVSEPDATMTVILDGVEHSVRATDKNENSRVRRKGLRIDYSQVSLDSRPPEQEGK